MNAIPRLDFSRNHLSSSSFFDGNGNILNTIQKTGINKSFAFGRVVSLNSLSIIVLLFFVSFQNLSRFPCFLSSSLSLSSLPSSSPALQSPSSFTFVAASSTIPPNANSIPLDIESRDVIELAYTALHKIQDLSETGIYRQITLNSINSAYFVDGIYHRNTVLNVSLVSPHFLSGKRSETYEVVVMERKEEEDDYNDDDDDDDDKEHDNDNAEGKGEEAEDLGMESGRIKINKFKSNDDITIAINEFPVMDPRAMEAFYIEMVEKKRRERNRLISLYS